MSEIPFPNFHTARIRNPGQYEEFRTSKDKFREGIDAIFGIKTGPPRKSELQAVRFDKTKFTVTEARRWLRENHLTPIMFEPAKVTKSFKTRIVKSDAKKGLVYGVVLEPEVIDEEDHMMTVEDIEKAAHGYLVNSRAVGIEHTEVTQDFVVVESYIAQDDLIFGEETVAQGSWILVSKALTALTKKAIEDGTFTGYSIGAYATSKEVD